MKSVSTDLFHDTFKKFHIMAAKNVHSIDDASQPARKKTIQVDIPQPWIFTPPQCTQPYSDQRALRSTVMCESSFLNQQYHCVVPDIVNLVERHLFSPMPHILMVKQDPNGGLYVICKHALWSWHTAEWEFGSPLVFDELDPGGPWRVDFIEGPVSGKLSAWVNIRTISEMDAHTFRWRDTGIEIDFLKNAVLRTFGLPSDCTAFWCYTSTPYPLTLLNSERTKCQRVAAPIKPKYHDKLAFSLHKDNTLIMFGDSTVMYDLCSDQWTMMSVDTDFSCYARTLSHVESGLVYAVDEAIFLGFDVRTNQGQSLANISSPEVEKLFSVDENSIGMLEYAYWGCWGRGVGHIYDIRADKWRREKMFDFTCRESILQDVDIVRCIWRP